MHWNLIMINYKTVFDLNYTCHSVIITFGNRWWGDVQVGRDNIVFRLIINEEG